MKKLAIVLFLFISGFAWSQNNANYEMDLQNKRNIIGKINKQEKEIIKDRESEVEYIAPSTSLYGNSNEKLTILKRVVVDKDGENISVNDNDFLKSYIGHGVSKQSIFEIIQKFNGYLADKGYVTSKVTLNPSNISMGEISFKILWGRVSEVTVNGKKADSIVKKLFVKQLVQFKEGTILNIRDLDQIVESGSNYAKVVKVNIIPDEAHENHSILDIITKENNVNAYNLSFDNSGPGSSAKSGLYRYSLSANYSDVVLGTDTLSLSTNTRHIEHDSGNKSYFYSFNYSFPIGYSSFSLGVSNSFSIDNASHPAGDYTNRANQKIYNVAANHIFYRASEKKLTGVVELNKRHPKNYFNDQFISVSSVQYADVGVGMQYTSSLSGRAFYADIKYNKGVHFFEGHKSGYDDALHRIYMERWLSNISITNPFSINGVSFDINSRFNIQYSKHHLLEIYKMAVGDEYSVRGFRDSNALGDSGVSVTNTLQLPPVTVDSWQFAPFVGYDIGYVYKNNHDSSSLSGSSFGVNSRYENINSSITLGIPLTYSSNLHDVEGYVFYFNCAYSF